MPFCQVAFWIAESKPLSFYGVIQSHGQDFAFIRKENRTQTPVLDLPFLCQEKCFRICMRNTRYGMPFMARKCLHREFQ